MEKTTGPRSKAAGEKDLIGVSCADDPPRILIETPTLQTILPSYEFVKADFGDELSNAIHMEFRRYLVTIEGENLKPLFGQIALNRVGRMSETPASKNFDNGETVIRKIVVARLETTEAEEANEE